MCCFTSLTNASCFLFALVQNRHVGFCMFDAFYLATAFDLTLFVVNCVDTPVIRSCSALEVLGSYTLWFCFHIFFGLILGLLDYQLFHGFDKNYAFLCIFGQSRYAYILFVCLRTEKNPLRCSG